MTKRIGRRGNAQPLCQAVEEQAQKQHRSAVIKKQRGSAGEATEKESRARRPPIALPRIPHRHKSHEREVTEHHILVQITRSEKHRRAESIEQRQPKRHLIGLENAPQQKKHDDHAEGRDGSHAKRVHHEGRQAELDIEPAPPCLFVELSRHRQG